MTTVGHLKERYIRVKEQVAEAAIRAGRDPSRVVLVAVTKYAEPDQIRELIQLGHVDFGGEFEVGGQFHDLVAMAHPHVQQGLTTTADMVGDVVQQATAAYPADLGVAEFTGVRTLYLAAELFGHGLHAVADAQHRDAQLKHAGRRPR